MPGLDPHVQLTLVHGDAGFLIDREARVLVDAILPPDEQTYGLTVTDLDATPVAEALGGLYMGSLLAGARVLLLRNLQALQAEAQKPLVEALGSIPPGASVILTHVSTRERKGYAVSAALTRLIKSKGQSLQLTTPYERELGQWAIAEAKQRGKRLDPPAAELLVELAGRDYGRLASELGKLCTYVGDAESISQEDVHRVAVKGAEATSFELVDAIAEGDAAKALSILPDLVPAHSAQSAAIPLLGMVARNLRLLWQAAYLARNNAPVDRGRVPESIADLLPSQHGIAEATRSSFVARKLARHARNFTDDQAAVSLERVLHADRALKGQTDEHLDARLVVERLVTELCLLSQRSRR
jgi:DNA polymerase-3 subunit delta